MDQQVKTNYKVLLTIILMIFTIGQITSDIYVPSMPAITEAFHSIASMIQWSMASYMLGFSLSQLIYGPLADHYGRRIIILIGMMIGVVGSIICLISNSPELLIIGRLIQGIGMGVGATLGRAIMRDLFSGSDLAKFGSILAIGTTLMVGSAPVIGGYLQHYLGWRSVFGFVAIYSAIVWFLVCFCLTETRPNIKRPGISLLKVFGHYKTLITNKTFLGYTLCTTIGYAGCLAFFTMSPFLLQTVLGFTAVVYGWLTIGIIAAFLVGGFLNAIFVKKIGVQKMMLMGASIAILAGVSMLIASLLGFINVWVIMVPAIIFTLGAEFLMINSFAGAFSPFPHIAGAAGALYGAIQILGGFITASLIALLRFTNQEPLAIIYLTLGVLVLIILTQLVMKAEK